MSRCLISLALTNHQRIKGFRQATFKITIKITAIGFGGERQMFEESVKRNAV